jgi:hypothetical protein
MRRIASLVVLVGALARGDTDSAVQQAGTAAGASIDEVQRKHGENIHSSRSAAESAVYSLDAIISMYNSNLTDHKAFMKVLEDGMIAANATALGGLKALDSAGGAGRQAAATALSQRMSKLIETRRDALRKDYDGAINGFRSRGSEFRAALMLGDFAERARDNLQATNFVSELDAEGNKVTRLCGVNISGLPSDVQSKLTAAVTSSVIQPMQRVISEEKSEFALDLLTADRRRELFGKVKEY